MERFRNFCSNVSVCVCVLLSFGCLIIPAQALWNECGVPFFL